IVDCPSEWMRFGNSCYLYENTRKINWDDAMEYCVSQGGYLAEVTDEAEFQLVNSTITANVFLGCRHYNGKWKWITSDRELLLNDTLWTPGEPAEGSKCLEIWKGKQFNDIMCERLNHVLCEKAVLFL
ncbi:C-type lectin domain family 6 member A, partial [Mytilus galloprovincialis]